MMISRVLTLCAVLLCCIVVFQTPLPAYAQTEEEVPPPAEEEVVPQTETAPEPTSTCPPGELCNPIETDDPTSFISTIIRTVLGVLGGIILLIFVYGGFLMLVSAGNSDRVQQGRDTLIWAAVGLIIIFGAYGIAEAIFRALS